jgi:hypothetical protein
MKARRISKRSRARQDARERRGLDVPYGLGHDFNEALMLAMAKAGRGNAYYGQTAADLAEPFAPNSRC